MSQFSSTQIPKPNDPEAFQNHCIILFAEVLNDPNVKANGKRGNRQHGVDLFGRRKGLGLDHWVGIQCKLAIRKTSITIAELSAEVEEAFKFEPALKEYILVSTAPDNASLDQVCRKFTSDQARLGREIEVQYWGWETLQHKISQFPRAMRAFAPDYSPFTDELLNEVRAIRSGVNHLSIQIVRPTDNRAILPSGGAAENSAASTILDGFIDTFRNLLNAGKAKTALDLLEDLWKKRFADFDPRLKYRVKANMAACHLRLNNELHAGELYLEAHSFYPNDSKAKAHQILGLTLLNRADEAVTIAKQMIDQGEREPAVIANAIFALKRSDEAVPLDAFVPKELLDQQDIFIARLDFYRSRGERLTWRSLAQKGVELFDEDDRFIRFAAEAKLDELVEKHQAIDERLLDAAELKELEGVTSKLKSVWNKACLNEEVWSDYELSLSANLATAYRLMRDIDEANQVLDYALNRSAEDKALRELQLFIAIETGDLDRAASSLEYLPPDWDAGVARAIIFAGTGRWIEFQGYFEKALREKFSEREWAFLESLKALSEFMLDNSSVSDQRIGELLHRYSAYAIVPIVLHEIAFRLGDRKQAQRLYELAVASPSQSLADKTMLANVAAKEGDFRTVVQLLDGQVPTGCDSEELRLLSMAFANDEITDRSLQFAEKLSPKLGDKLPYAKTLGIIFYRAGDLSNASGALRKAYKLNANDAQVVRLLISSLLRQTDSQSVEEIINGLKPRILKGNPGELIHIAHFMVRHNRAKEGLEWAYDIALLNSSDADVARRYITLFLPDELGIEVPAKVDVVAPNCTVTIQNTVGISRKITIADKIAPSVGNEVPLNHPIAEKTLGRKVGDLFFVENAGEHEEWKITSINHKYVELFQTLINQFNFYHPDDKSLQTVRTTDADIKPLLNLVKERSESEEKVFKLYQENGIPLEMAGNALGLSGTEFAGQIIQRRGLVKTALGTIDERDKALTLLRRSTPEAVLDSFTAYVVVRLELLSQLKRIFKKILIPQSVLDDIQIEMDRQRAFGDRDFLTVQYKDGEYFRHEVSAERVNQLRQWTAHFQNTLRSECQVVPVVPAERRNEKDRLILEACGGGFLDSIDLCRSRNALLLSDDLMHRSLAKTEYNCEGIWAQVSLLYGRQLKLVSRNEYAEAFVGFCSFREAAISIDGDILLSILDLEQSSNLEKYSIALNSLWLDNAEITSHLAVTRQFLEEIWTKSRYRDKRASATGLLLEKAVKYFHQVDQANTFLSHLIALSNRDLQDYIFKWMRGHFITLN